MLLVACIIGASGGWISSHINHNDGPPACAKRWAGVSGVSNADANKMVECDDQIDKWCAKNHPEDPDGCSNNITIDGDARNVGKG